MGRPKKLQTRLVEAYSRIAKEKVREVLAGVIAEKLQDQGVSPMNFPMEEFIEHVISGNQNGSFSWDEADVGSAKINLDFTLEDVETVRKAVDARAAALKGTFKKILTDSAKALLNTLIDSFPEEKAHQEIDSYGFRKRLGLRWGKVLDLFQMLLVVSSELLDQMMVSLSKSKATKGIDLRDVLLGIHARALRTGRAILVLLQHGMADEAYARWRTLYELSVIADFISIHGEEAAIRYRDHEIVARQRSVENSAAWGYPIRTADERKLIRSDYDDILKYYGKEFSSPYGWASLFLNGNPSPKFVDLEFAVKGNRTAPPYKESSLQIHGGRAGLFGLGSLDSRIIIAGTSNAGLDIPVMHSSLAILQITSTALSNSPAKDLLVLQTLVLLDKRIHREARKVARALEQEERELRDA